MASDDMPPMAKFKPRLFVAIPCFALGLLSGFVLRKPIETHIESEATTLGTQNASSSVGQSQIVVPRSSTSATSDGLDSILGVSVVDLRLGLLKERMAQFNSPSELLQLLEFYRLDTRFKHRFLEIQYIISERIGQIAGKEALTSLLGMGAEMDKSFGRLNLEATLASWAMAEPEGAYRLISEAENIGEADRASLKRQVLVAAATTNLPFVLNFLSETSGQELNTIVTRDFIAELAARQWDGDYTQLWNSIKTDLPQSNKDVVFNSVVEQGLAQVKGSPQERVEALRELEQLVVAESQHGFNSSHIEAISKSASNNFRFSEYFDFGLQLTSAQTSQQQQVEAIQTFITAIQERDLNLAASLLAERTNLSYYPLLAEEFAKRIEEVDEESAAKWRQSSKRQ
jgi:hypothetical protein